MLYNAWVENGSIIRIKDAHAWRLTKYSLVQKLDIMILRLNYPMTFKVNHAALAVFISNCADTMFEDWLVNIVAIPWKRVSSNSPFAPEIYEIDSLVIHYGSDTIGKGPGHIKCIPNPLDSEYGVYISVSSVAILDENKCI